jgi:MFS family permease
VLRHDRVLATVTGATCVGQLGAGALPVVAAVLAERWYGPAWAGWLVTVAAAAGLVGSLAWTWRPAPPDRAPRVVVLGLVGVGVPLATAAASSSLAVMVALFALSGLFQGPLFGALLLTRERQAPQRQRAQVFAVSASAKITATATGAALCGALSGAPVGVQLVLAGGWPVLAGGVGLAVLGLRSSAR